MVLACAEFRNAAEMKTEGRRDDEDGRPPQTTGQKGPIRGDVLAPALPIGLVILRQLQPDRKQTETTEDGDV